MGRKVAIGGILTTLALMFSYVDSQFSLALPLPAVKLGLANCVILVSMYSLGNGTAFTVNILRIFLSNLLFGSPVSAAYGLTGGILSFFIMVFLKKTDKFSPVGISIGGATAHIWGQLAVAGILTATPGVFYLAPVYMGISLVTGLVLGYLALQVCNRLHLPIRQ